MDAVNLYRAGQLREAIKALGDELRKKPLDAKRRTFLFELLCFAGEYDRAEKQLDVLAVATGGARRGSLLYRSCAARRANAAGHVCQRRAAGECEEAVAGGGAGTASGSRRSRYRSADCGAPGSVYRRQLYVDAARVCRAGRDRARRRGCVTCCGRGAVLQATPIVPAARSGRGAAAGAVAADLEACG